MALRSSHRRHLPLVMAVVVLAHHGPGGLLAAGQENSTEYTMLVERLDDPVFQARSDAASQLVAAATTADQRATAKVIESLHSGLRHESCEVRIASGEALSMIRQVRYDQQVAHLLDPTRKAEGIQLPGWKTYRNIAGQDMAARSLFVKMCDRFPSEFRQIAWPLSVASLEQPASELDPYTLTQDDPVAWSVVLLTDLHRLAADSNRETTKQTHRIGSALANSAFAPRVTGPPQTCVLARLVRGWIHHCGNTCTRPVQLMGAMRYRCDSIATAICDEILNDADAPPASVAMALLCGSVLNSDEVQQHAEHRLDDDRAAHVWELIASRRKRIRTEVRDVALALLLHRQGIDPRKAHFHELQADPLLVYRLQSLGFQDQASRRRARQRAFELMVAESAR